MPAPSRERSQLSRDMGVHLGLLAGNSSMTYPEEEKQQADPAELPASPDRGQQGSGMDVVSGVTRQTRPKASFLHQLLPQRTSIKGVEGSVLLEAA